MCGPSVCLEVMNGPKSLIGVLPDEIVSLGQKPCKTALARWLGYRYREGGPLQGRCRFTSSHDCNRPMQASRYESSRPGKSRSDYRTVRWTGVAGSRTFDSVALESQ